MSCSTSGGCSSNGSSGCTKHNTFDWLANLPAYDNGEHPLVEIQVEGQFHKRYAENNKSLELFRGDWVKIRAHRGYDLGQITASGELAKLGHLRKIRELNDRGKGKTNQEDSFDILLDKANEKEIKAHQNQLDKRLMYQKKVRDIAREMQLPVKVSDVIYRGDCQQATVYYTSDKRIDFREWVRQASVSLSTRVEMRQISDRQEAGVKGGLGPCGRELCCSSWMTKFDSVSTSAARYQQLAINNEKLAGQCGRLKCCLNFELQTYIEAKAFMPKRVKDIKSPKGTYEVVSVDYLTKSISYRSPSGELVVVSPKEYNDLRQRVQDGKDVESVFSKAKQFLPKENKQDPQAHSMDMAFEGVDLDSFVQKRKKDQGRSHRKGHPPRRKNKRR
ncbi:MAG: regulatory iron-sulfur-containing complex subunit RicT [Bacteroidota bacterium]|nr:regulatory iron-sulfur-containing complex subunit RicT [Bacteroidota bacterium]